MRHSHRIGPLSPAPGQCGIVQQIGGRTLLKWILVAALVAGCGGDEELPAACSQGEQAVTAALASAPRAVRIEAPGGRGRAAISACMTDAADASDVQALGAAVNGTAAKLADVAEERPDSTEALRLGYLVGAVERGSTKSQGLHSELKRRLEQEVGRVDRSSPAFRRGERAGRTLG